MQLQIECNRSLRKQKLCLICSQSFEMTEAKIIVCNDQGNNYGEVCPECLKKGFVWLSDRFEQLNQPKKIVAMRPPQNLKAPVGA
jgi:predicted amidophosphoribosyltransferase